MPLFEPGLPSEVNFSAENNLLYQFPPIVDADGDDVVLTADTSAASWLSFNSKIKALIVIKGDTSESDIGEYTIPIKLKDGYEYGPNENLFFIRIIVRPVEKPFYILKPKNDAPFFDNELTEE